MANTIRMLGSYATAAGSANRTTLDNAENVYVVNTTNSYVDITVISSKYGTTSISLGGNDNIIIQKEKTDQIWHTLGARITKVAHTRG